MTDPSVRETVERRMREAEQACRDVLDRATAAYFALSEEEQRRADLRALEFLATGEWR
jgi:hypothetical protein